MPKKTIPLTDVAIRNAKAADKPVKMFDGAGLFLQVTPTGGKLWRFKYLFDGKEKLLALGKWPDVGLKMARQRREEARTLVAQGVDPSEKRKQDKSDAEAQVAEDANTFEVVARDWHAKQVKVWSEGHAAKVLGRIEQHLFPAFGNIPISSLRAPAILPTLREIEAKGSLWVAEHEPTGWEAVTPAVGEDSQVTA
ncbi:MAG: tyrosine-type recombinase/integrase [Solidesulfovibrio sp.]